MNVMRYLKSNHSRLSPDDIYIHFESFFFSFGIYVGYEGLEVRSVETEIIGVDLA